MYCPPPTAADRAAAFEQQRNLLPWAAAAVAAGATAEGEEAEPPEVSWLVAQTEGYTVADLGHLGRAVLYAAAARRRRDRQQKQQQQQQRQRQQQQRPQQQQGEGVKDMLSSPAGAALRVLTVLRCDYESALATVQPSVPPRVRHRYEIWRPPS